MGLLRADFSHQPGYETYLEFMCSDQTRRLCLKLGGGAGVDLRPIADDALEAVGHLNGNARFGCAPESRVPLAGSTLAARHQKLPTLHVKRLEESHRQQQGERMIALGPHDRRRSRKGHAPSVWARLSGLALPSGGFKPDSLAQIRAREYWSGVVAADALRVSWPRIPAATDAGRKGGASDLRGGQERAVDNGRRFEGSTHRPVAAAVDVQVGVGRLAESALVADLAD